MNAPFPATLQREYTAILADAIRPAANFTR
jgi:hypothetical protein